MFYFVAVSLCVISLPKWTNPQILARPLTDPYENADEVATLY